MLEEIKVAKKMDRDTLVNVARTSLRTKLHTQLADLLTEVSAVSTHAVNNKIGRLFSVQTRFKKTSNKTWSSHFST